MVKTNQWDPEPVARFRADPVVQSIHGAIDSLATTEQLEHIGSLFPPEWLTSAAIGTPEECAALVANQFKLGVDGVIMHGATPQELAPVVEAYRPLRDSALHAGLVANPGGRRGA